MKRTWKSYWNLYRFELKQNYKSFLIWFAVIAVIMTLFMLTFPSFKSADYLELVNAKINALPKGFGAAFGLGGITGVSFQNIFFFFSYMSQFFVIAITIYAINLGSNIMAKENKDKHIDYLATKPIKKSTIVLAKYKALITFVALLTFGLFLLGCILIPALNRDNTPFFYELLRLTAKTFLIYVFFGTLAFSLTAISKSTSKSNLLVVGIFFISFLLGVYSQIQPQYEKLKYLAPTFVFEVTNAGYKFTNTDYWYMFGLAGISVIMFVLGFWRYVTKDLSLC
jgi:ABC-2 type transport system permease protein